MTDSKLSLSKTLSNLSKLPLVFVIPQTYGPRRLLNINLKKMFYSKVSTSSTYENVKTENVDGAIAPHMETQMIQDIIKNDEGIIKETIKNMVSFLEESLLKVKI
jgi:hypothetical protein